MWHFRPLLLLSLLAGCGVDADQHSSCSAPGNWKFDNTLGHGGFARKYDVYEPLSASNGSASALVIFLHGAGGYTSKAPEAYRMWPVNPYADSYGFVAIVPLAIDAMGKAWNDGEDCTDDGTPKSSCPDGHPDDVDFIDTLIAQLKSTYTIPAGKVFVYGFSNGAGLAAMISCVSTQVDAVAVQGGYVPSEAHWSKYCPQKRGPSLFWAGLGSVDGLMALDQGKDGLKFFVETVNGCNGGIREIVLSSSGVTCYEYRHSNNVECSKGRYCEYQGMGHVFPPGAVPASWEFFNADSYPANITADFYRFPAAQGGCQSQPEDDHDDDDGVEDDDEDEDEDEDEETGFDDDDDDDSWSDRGTDGDDTITCSDLKNFYRDSECCGHLEKSVVKPVWCDSTKNSRISCAEVKAHFRAENCCGMMSKTVSVPDWC